MKVDPKERGKRIQQLRKDKGLTQEELAAQLNVSPNLIAKIECGLRQPSIDFVVDCVNFFGTTVDYIVRGKKLEDEIDKEIQKIDEIVEKWLEYKEKLLELKNNQ